MGSMRTSMSSASSSQEPILGGEKDPSLEAPTSPASNSSHQGQAFKAGLSSPQASPWSARLKDSSLLSQSSKNSSGVFCRICHDGEAGGERLISPCLCSGSVGLVHRSCIEKWLSSVNKDTCELCQQKYRVSRHSRPFSSWLLTPAVGDDQRNLMGDTVCFMLLTPLTTISAYLCASGASYYFHQIKKSEAVGLLALASMLIFIYLIWLLLTIRYHFQVWFKWRLNNQDIRLLDVSNNMPGPSKTSGSQLDRSIQNRIFSQPADLESTHITAEAPENLSSTFFSTSQLQKSGAAYSHRDDTDVILEIEESLEEKAEGSEPASSSRMNMNLPLTPTVIPQDPQRDSVYKAVKRTKESVVYEEIAKDLRPSYASEN